jgi:outer membrane protein OmpA-like peptidoglycan-associated protein
MALSNDRAKSVMNFLVMRGISADRIAARGYGKTRPIATNDTPEGRAKNRRVEVIPIK